MTEYGKATEKRIKMGKYYLDIAVRTGQLSYDDKYKVGCIIVSPDRSTILAQGYNGTPMGYNNDTRRDDGVTKWEVIHAETNAITKLARSSATSEGAILYTTLSPCKECAKMIIQAGIKEVNYIETYDREAVSLLGLMGVDCYCFGKDYNERD